MIVRKPIFIGGIHGVGKTEFCKALSSQLQVDYVSASDLIRQSGISPSNEQKQVEQVTVQQDILLTALNNYRPNSSTFLLDGHFCLLTEKPAVEDIPLATFEGIAPSAVIVLRTDVEIIQQRLKSRSQIELYSLEFITDFQNREVAHASAVCNSLQVPLLITSPDKPLSDTISFLQTNSII